MAGYHRLSASELARGIAAGDIGISEALEQNLQHLNNVEPTIRAWAYVDEEGARREALLLEQELKRGHVRGPLHGVPVGVKDVLHAEGMPTTANSRALSADQRYPDSGVVQALRRAGAIILGKCETVEFAGLGDIPATRNPWNYDHTAGGSSSGSGAAVGASTVPVAIGTQTGGSNLRPASYCGVAGFKPSYGGLSRRGLLPVSYSLDHPGIIAKSAEDLKTAFNAIAKDPGHSYTAPSKRKFGIIRDFFMETAEPETASLIEQSLARLRDSGVDIVDVSLPASFRAHKAAHRFIMQSEMVTYHAHRLAEQRADMAERHCQAIMAYSLVPANYYVQALRAKRLISAELAERANDVDVLIAPTNPAPAPKGFGTTGDSSFLVPWSFVGFPTATIPCGISTSGLPIGLQIIGGPRENGRVLDAAIYAQSILGRLDLPSLEDIGGID